jgi:hypothetical protein
MLEDFALNVANKVKQAYYTPRSSAMGESMVRTTASGALEDVNIIEDYRWTISPIKNSLLKDKIPRIFLREYQMTQNMLVNGLNYYASNIIGAIGSIGGDIEHYSNNNNKDVAYEGLFDYNSPTNYQYVFPYYNEENFNIASTWTSLDAIEKTVTAAANVAGIFGNGAKDAVQSITDIMQGAAGAAQGLAGLAYPKTGFLDKTKIWGETTPQSVTISFYLFNTYDSKDILENWRFCNHICHQNLYSKITFITAYPPVFYRVDIPGQYSSIGSFVSNLKISNVGNIRRMKFDDMPEVNVPDAYLITMTLEDMVMPSRNLLNRVSSEYPKISTSVKTG